MEQFKNFGLTTLNGAINNSQTTITVINSSVFPVVGNFRLRIDNEFFLATAVAGNVITVVRGADNSTPVSHLDGAQVSHPLTSGALAQFRLDTFAIDNIVNHVPTVEGRLLITSDDNVLIRDNGVSVPLSSFGYLPELRPPNLSGWAWFNQGAATIDTSLGHIYLEGPASTTSVHRGQQIATPTPPFTFRVFAQPLLFPVNFLFAGIGLYENSTGKTETIHFVHSTNGFIEQNKWDNFTTYNSTRASVDTLLGGNNVNWLQIHHDGTNISYQYSWDGQNWTTLASQAKNNFFTTDADHCYFFINAAHGTWKAGVSILDLQLF